jgi:energy-coupling factor transporter ATP-binding protein EcfA2
MITKITFNNSEKGYLNYPHIKNVLKRGRTIEQYNQALEDPQRYKKYGRDIADYFFKEVIDGFENQTARSCLLGKSFEFSKDKINIIFGPNASGKSTILKSIANYALCGGDRICDGFTNVEKYRNIDYGLSETPNEDLLKRNIFNSAGNVFEIEWDGNPVYYQNYSNRKSTGTIDDWNSPLFGSFRDNILFEMNKSKSSDGMITADIMGYIFQLAESKYSVENIKKEFERVSKSKELCGLGYEPYQVSYDWIMKHYNKIKYSNHVTFLFDEIDKSLDILNTKFIFKYILPEIKKINNDQIIVVSHSPLILSESIANKENYNIISLDEEYTQKVRKLISNL